MKRRARPFLFAAMLGLLLAGGAAAADTGHYVLGDTTAKTPGATDFPGSLLFLEVLLSVKARRSAF